MGNLLLKVLKERGFIEQTTHDSELEEYINKDKATCYVGFDPTASSLHVGSLVPIMSMAHFQSHGHRPIALIGGGTGLVGDPSGKTEMRKLLTQEIIEENIKGIKRQLSNFINFGEKEAILLNNGCWLSKLKYIPFLRDIGRHFSVNRMIKAESYKIRLDSEEGLNFIEFNYMLLQSYDYLYLFDNYGCKLQMGGSDQWGNVVAGIELIRRTRNKTAFGITFPLVTTSNGAKMGKTATGAVWLDPDRTSPYEYYQYWINTDDRDVVRFLSLFTFLPMDEIKRIEKLKDVDLNIAKTVLAFEATLLAHGRNEAVDAFNSAVSMFGVRTIPKDILPSSTILRSDSHSYSQSIPSFKIKISQLKDGIPAFKVFHMIGLSKSNGEARRLIDQGGAYINGIRVESIDYLVSERDCNSENEIICRAGKKRFHKINVDN